MRKLKKYKPTPFMAEGSHYDKAAADYAVMFIESLCHTKGTWARKPFELIDWQEQIIRDLFGILKPNGYRQFNTAYVEIPKKMGKSELAAAVERLKAQGQDTARQLGEARKALVECRLAALEPEGLAQGNLYVAVLDGADDAQLRDGISAVTRKDPMAVCFLAAPAGEIGRAHV